MKFFSPVVIVVGALAGAGLLSGCAAGNAPVNPALQVQPVTGSSKDAKVNAFFDVGPLSTELKLPADEIFPRGQKLGFSFYSIGGGSEKQRGERLPEALKAADQQRIINAGVTLLGPQYELNDEVAALARTHQRKAIYTLTPIVDGQPVTIKSFETWNREKRAFPEKAMIDSIVAQVRAVAADPAIAWWDLTPEELRFWRKSEMTYLQEAVVAIRANDPLKRPIMMYEPVHRDAKALARTLPFLDFVTKGLYTNYTGMTDDRVWVRHSIGESSAARKLMPERELTILALPEMFQEPKDAAGVKLIPSWVRHDVYSALGEGAQGVLVFSASRRRDFTVREKYLDAYLQVCRELTGGLDLGRVFLFGKRCDDLTFQTIDGPETVTLKLKDSDKSFPAVALYNIAFNHVRYVFLVNSTRESVDGVVSGLPYGSDVKVKNLFDARAAYVAAEGEFSVALPPWGVAGFMVFRGE